MFSKKSVFLQDDNRYVYDKNNLSCNINGQNISFEFRTITPEPQLGTAGQVIYTFGGIPDTATNDIRRLIWASGSYECTMNYHGVDYRLHRCQSASGNPLVTNAVAIEVFAIEEI